jgi:hypothetical protein
MLGSLPSSIPFILFLIVTPSLGAIGPTADLEIVNMDVSPDGFTRSAISAGGEGVVGSLITANKGDTISINVINSLDDANMLEATSIVSITLLENEFLLMIAHTVSTGTGSFKTLLITRMGSLL